MPLFRTATFSISAASTADPLPHSVAEIAFTGRSNAGKSSAINTLVGRRRLAFVSKAPGRTRLINFFELGGERFLVDLPGYGYASAPGPVRAQWDRLLSAYLQQRAPLKGLALVMDIRHPMTELDLQLLEFLRPTGKPVHVLLSKADKLSRERAVAVLGKVRGELAALSPRHSVQLFSSLKRSGVEEAEAVFSNWLGMDAPRDAAKPVAQNKKPRAKGG
jgi:GTP-binding protein